MEVFLDPNRDVGIDVHIIMTRVKSSILVNFGDCGLGSFQGSIRACKDAALKCDELKFEHYKNEVRPRVTAEINQHMQNCLEKIKTFRTLTRHVNGCCVRLKCSNLHTRAMDLLHGYLLY